MPSCQPRPSLLSGTLNSAVAHHTNGPSRVFVVLIDAITRPLFNQRYTSTLRMLREQRSHTLYSYDTMHTHGPNSLPNKWPLFFARVQPDRAHAANSTNSLIHRVFERHGYVTVHADDACAPLHMPGTLTSMVGGAPAHLVPPSDDDGWVPRLCPRGQSDGGKSQAKSSLAFVESAVERNAHCRIFATVNLNHEHLSTERHVSTHADEWLYAFVRRVITPDSVVVILSDHGLHYGKHLERPAAVSHRTNPPLHVLWPNDRTEGAVSLRRATSATLVSHMDVYALLAGLATETVPTNSPLSLHFPLQRTCADVGIAPVHCRCVLFGACASTAVQRARSLLESRLDAARHPACEELSISQFKQISCTGGDLSGSAFRASFSRRTCHTCANRVFELLFSLLPSRAGVRAGAEHHRQLGLPADGALLHQLTAHDAGVVFRHRCGNVSVPPAVATTGLCACARAG